MRISYCSTSGRVSSGKVRPRPPSPAEGDLPGEKVAEGMVLVERLKMEMRMERHLIINKMQILNQRHLTTALLKRSQVGERGGGGGRVSESVSEERERERERERE